MAALFSNILPLCRAYFIDSRVQTKYVDIQLQQNTSLLKIINLKRNKVNTKLSKPGCLLISKQLFRGGQCGCCFCHMPFQLLNPLILGQYSL